MSETLSPGTIFAGYRIERVLGSGGMGAVYLARHPRLPRRDALKVLSEEHGADVEARMRFIREAELAARLDHPNIVTVHDRGVEDGRLWIAMQFVDGIDASALVREVRPVPVERTLHIVAEAARGLDAAHRAGMLHRDVKPANILIQPGADTPDRVYVSDFGIAKSIGETGGLTRTGAVLATLAYSAPEQLAAQPLDHRTDVYALTCTLYELLTGEKPFRRANPGQVMMAHLYDPPPRVTAIRPELPAAVDDVIAQGLAKDPGDRYSSCGALANAAVTAFGGTADPTLETGASSSGKSYARVAARPRRRRTVLIAAIVGLVIAATASGIAAVITRDPTDPPPTSTSAPTTALTWANYDFVIRAFPKLMPADPISSGYQGMLCSAYSGNGPVSPTSEPGSLVQMTCNGDRNPLSFLRITCNGNRSPSSSLPPNDLRNARDERWDRAGATGQIIWGDITSPSDTPAGALVVKFDDPARNFCGIAVFGGNSGQDLYDRWWRDAPL